MSRGGLHRMTLRMPGCLYDGGNTIIDDDLFIVFSLYEQRGLYCVLEYDITGSFFNNNLQLRWCSLMQI